MLLITNTNQLQESLLALQKESLIACDVECSELDFRKGKLEGIGFGTDKLLFFIPFPTQITQDTLVEFFTNLFTGRQVIFHNAKYDLQVFAHNKLPIPKQIQDTMIMSWMVDENSLHGLKQLAKTILRKNPKEWIQLNKNVDLFRTEDDVLQELAEYCCEDVANTFLLYHHFRPLLSAEKLDIAYDRIENRLIPILCAMEMRGIMVDVNLLNQLHEEAQAELQALEAKIQASLKTVLPSGYPPVNIRSGKQLEDILFNICHFPVIKETDKGTKSTDEESLLQIIKKEKLPEDHFLPLLIQFRDLYKIDSTYLTALAEQAGLANTLHCNFKQHGTRTGRLSSSEPNLQNIPSRADKWNIRRTFIPRPGYKFIMADYSQLELRVMAHFSEDPTMIKTFQEGGDIHAETMKATGTDRHTSKTLNFAIIYGMGPRTLAQELKIKEDDAKRYIYKFFQKYKGVKAFIDRTQIFALKYGYVQMITGRRRHFTEIADQRWWNAIKRQSVNTKIQGSGADLVKAAMISLYPLLKELGAYMLVQIHDEILVEVPEDKTEEVKAIIKERMENVLKFKVPMVVNIVEADRWVK